ncbi:hypothetical protein PgNI_05166, partial [Pyricularia grisea]|uniref:Cytochrome P450 n=1 Tax=Pyricularia grisea TaxID=148305 RepID=A0A6P8B704_PYRGI
LIYFIIYNTYIHPLSKYPGPFLAKFTDLYAAYHGWKGDLHLDMWRCHQKYGDRVRYAPNALLVNTAEGLRDIYSFGPSSSFSKGATYEPMIHRAPNTLTIRGGREHARRRRILSQGLSERALRSYEPRIMSHIQTLAGVVAADATLDARDSRLWGAPVDMGSLCSYLTFDIMADVVFDERYSLLTEHKFRYVVDAIEISNTRMAGLIQAPWFARHKLDRHLFRAAIKSRNRFLKFLGGMLGSRMKRLSRPIDDAKDTQPNDLFGNLAVAKDPDTGSSFTANELAAESATLVFAGTDTSSTALAAVLFYLAHNPSCYARAAAEVRSVFGVGHQVTGQRLPSCVYLKACVEEALRMSPPVGGTPWREVSAAQGAVVDGEHLPRGTTVGVGIYSVQHSCAYYDEPFQYRPERWLADSPGNDAEKVNRARSVFAPFSVGPRSCLGRGLAQHELMLATATLLNVGDFRLPDGRDGVVGCGTPGAELGRHREGEFQLKDFITGQKDGPILQFSMF